MLEAVTSFPWYESPAEYSALRIIAGTYDLVDRARSRSREESARIPAQHRERNVRSFQEESEQ